MAAALRRVGSRKRHRRGGIAVGRVALVTTDDHRAMSVMHHVIADASHDGATHGAEAPSSHHDHRALLLGGYVRYHLARLAAKHCLYLPGQLQSKPHLHTFKPDI